MSGDGGTAWESVLDTRSRWVIRNVREGHTIDCALEMWHGAECSCEVPK